VGANDRMTAPEILLHISHVHGTALALRTASRLPQQLSHDLVCGDAAVDGNPVIR